MNIEPRRGDGQAEAQADVEVEIIAAAYVLADSIDELASKIGTGGSDDSVSDESLEVHELAAGATVDEVIAAFLRESVEYSTRVHSPGS